MVSVTNLGQTRECLSKAPVVLGVLVGHFVELGLVSFELLDVVNEVNWLLEELEVLGVNKVAELVLNLDNELDGIKRVKTVVGKGTVEGKGSLARRAEVVSYDGEHVLLDLVAVGEHSDFCSACCFHSWSSAVFSLPALRMAIELESRPSSWR